MTNLKTSLKKAEQYCTKNNLRFTIPRQRVLEILARHHEPMGAYDVLHQLGAHMTNPKPPTAYRAIDFWRKHGFVHKIESLNAYVTCCGDHKHSDTHFLVCDDCKTVEEIHIHNIQNTQNHNGFISKYTFAETHGTCGDCLHKN